MKRGADSAVPGGTGQGGDSKREPTAGADRSREVALPLSNPCGPWMDPDEAEQVDREYERGRRGG